MANALAANGATVYVSGRRKDVLQDATRGFSGEPGALLPLQMDVTDKKSIRDAANRIAQEHGRLDILINK